MVRKIAALIIISLSIAGCGSLIFSKGPGKMILVLGDGVRGCPDKETLTGSPLAIIAVRDRTSSPLINSSKILTSAAKGQRGYYHYSFWSEPPPARLLKLVADKLECLGTYRALISEAADLQSKDSLVLSVREFYHNVSNEPGEVVIEIRAEFRHAESGTVQVRDFREVEKVSQFDSHGALLAFDAGSARIVEAIAIWTGILGC